MSEKDTTIEASSMLPPSVATATAPKRARSYSVDLRVHSPISLGYLAIEGIDTAPAIVRLAKVKGLDMMAVTDYFSGAFIDRVANAAAESSLTIIPGFVLRCAWGSCDDVTLGCLFPEHFTGAMVEAVLRRIGVPELARGDREFVLRTPLAEVIATVEAEQGIIIPTRMDKTPQQLACVPALVEQFGFRAFDMAYSDSDKFFKARWPKMKFLLLTFSNANALAQVGSRTAKLKLDEAGFSGLRRLVRRAS